MFTIISQPCQDETDLVHKRTSLNSCASSVRVRSIFLISSCRSCTSRYADLASPIRFEFKSYDSCQSHSDSYDRIAEQAYRLAENLATLLIVHNGLDFFRCSIRFHCRSKTGSGSQNTKGTCSQGRTNLELTLHSLLVPRPVLLLDRLVVLNSLDELLLH